jgi:galactokinase/mevalonate kinase-like predicted kinase
MKISYSAPGRAGIIGNPSDMYGGCVISCSTPVRNRCTIEESDEWHLPEDTRLWNAATKRLPLERPYKVTWDTDVPRSSGLSGSTALLAATVACILTARGKQIPDDRREFAELVRDIELREADIVCGYQDAYMCVLGGMNSMNFAGKHPIDSGPLGLVTPIELPGKFLLVTTGVERLSGSVHGPIRDRWLSGDPEAIRLIDELTEMAKKISVDPTIENLTHSMNRNFQIIQELGGSGEDIDRLVQDCLMCGATAAKLAGAGMGGTVIALCHNPQDLQQSLAKIGYTKFLQPVSTNGLTREA